MAMKQDSRHCAGCNRVTLHGKPQFGFGWGCLLTILTGGIFIPIWLLADLVDCFGSYVCQTCGRKN